MKSTPLNYRACSNWKLIQKARHPGSSGQRYHRFAPPDSVFLFVLIVGA